MSDGVLVLIIEDNPRNLKPARGILNHSGYETLEAENAADGLGLARARHPELVFWTSSSRAWTACRRSSTWPRSRWTSCCWTS